MFRDYGLLLISLLLLLQFQNCSADGTLKNQNQDLQGKEEIPFLDTNLVLHDSWIDTSKLVGYWRFDLMSAQEGDSIFDSSPRSTTGMLKTNNDSGSKFDSSVKFGGALRFDGVDDFVSIGNPADKHLDFAMNSFSYMVWVKVNSSAGPWDMPIWKGGNSADRPGYDIELGNSAWAAYVSDGTAIYGAEFGLETEFLGRWVHLAVVVDRETKQLRTYVDGQLKNAKNISSLGSINANDEIKIGAGYGSAFFKGSLDDVAIWQTALSDSDILNIYKHLRLKF